MRERCGKGEWLSASFWESEENDLYPHLTADGVWDASFLNLSIENLKILTTGILQKEGRFAQQQVQVRSVKAIPDSLQAQLKALQSQNFHLPYQIQDYHKLVLKD